MKTSFAVKQVEKTVNRIQSSLRNCCHRQFSTIQSLSHVRLFAIPWTAACQASLSITNSWSLLKLMSIELWCHPTISSSVVPFSSCLQSFPASGSFLSQFFTSSGQSIGASASASVLPMSIQDWFPLQNWLVWSPCSPRDSQESSEFNITVQKPQFFGTQLSLRSSCHIHTWLLEKPKLWLDGPLLAKYCVCFLICYLVWS